MEEEERHFTTATIGPFPSQESQEKISVAYCFRNFTWRETAGWLFSEAITYEISKRVLIRPADHVGSARSYAICIGVTLRLVQLVILANFLADVLDSKSFERKETLDTELRSYIDVGSLYDVSEDPPFCFNTTKYWYQDYVECGGLAQRTTGCEYNITCAHAEYAQMSRKESENDFYVYTYMKETSLAPVACPENASSAAACEPDEYLWQSPSGRRCKCWKTSNMFLVGAENHEFVMRHSYKALTKLGGTTRNSWAELATRVVRRNDGKLLHTFPAGIPLSATVQQWLAWSGLDNLEDVNTDAEKDYPPGANISGSENRPVFRMTGVKIEMELVYNGSIGIGTWFPVLHHFSPPLEAYLVIGHHGGYHSFGSDTQSQYLNDGGINAGEQESTSHLLDGRGMKIRGRYTRGIKFEVTSHGQLGEFYLTGTLLALTGLLVYLQLTPTLIEVVAHTLGLGCGWLNHLRKRYGHKANNVAEFIRYESKVWRFACREKFSLDGLHARRLFNSLLVNMIFKSSEDLHDRRRITFSEAENMWKRMLTESQTYRATTSSLNLNAPQDEKRLKTRKDGVLNEKDATSFAKFLVLASNMKDTTTPIEERTISVNRVACMMLTGFEDEPSLRQCLLHAEATLPSGLRRIHDHSTHGHGSTSRRSTKSSSAMKVHPGGKDTEVPENGRTAADVGALPSAVTGEDAEPLQPSMSAADLGQVLGLRLSLEAKASEAGKTE